MRLRRKRESNEEASARRVAELTASRRIIVEAYEVERRRIERELHDGAQQYLVAAAMKVGEARLAELPPEVAGLLDDAAVSIQAGLNALRSTIRGIHPQILSQRGLAAALEEVAANSAHSVRIVCPHPLPELPEGVLAIGYFFACEAINNAAKHAPGAQVTVLLVADQNLMVSVMDNGSGGAVITPEGGLAGLKERLAAVGGTMRLSSPLGGPTQVVATVPLLLTRGETGVVLS